MKKQIVSVLVLQSLLVLASALAARQPGTSPIKVFILAGQSNMEGQAVVELTGPWVQAPGAWAMLRKAQAAAAARPEFHGNVIFVETHDFVRKPEESPNPGHGHHEFGNAETYLLVGDALGKGMRQLLTSKPD